MLEKYIQRDVVRFLKCSGCLVFRMNAGRGKNNIHLAEAGTPDLLAVWPKGDVWWLEIKSEGKELRPDQVKMKNELEKRKQKHFVITSVYDLIEMLR